LRGYLRVSQTNVLIGVLALFIALLANIGIGVRSYYNCKSIENLKTAVRGTLVESRTFYTSGARDEVLQRIYGSRWEHEKEDAIAKINRQIHRFDPDKCNIFRR